MERSAAWNSVWKRSISLNCSNFQVPNTNASSIRIVKWGTGTWWWLRRDHDNVPGMQIQFALKLLF